MTIQPPSELNLLKINPEEQGARYWYERYREQLAETEQLKQRVKELEEQFGTLSDLTYALILQKERGQAPPALASASLRRINHPQPSTPPKRQRHWRIQINFACRPHQ